MDSLSSILLTTRLSVSLGGLPVSPSLLYQAGTVEALAQRLQATLTSGSTQRVKGKGQVEEEACSEEEEAAGPGQVPINPETLPSTHGNVRLREWARSGLGLGLGLGQDADKPRAVTAG